MDIVKFPRTRHIQGSRPQMGDVADDKPVRELQGLPLVITEKLDGANCAISFDVGGGILLQSRGNYLIGGGRERHFDLFKTWAHAHAHALNAALGSRYVMYGEWLYAKHTIFYDRLPHYFLEFDVLDLEGGAFLSTEARRDLLTGLAVTPVPVVLRGTVTSVTDLARLIRPSPFKSPTWRETLSEAAEESGSRSDLVRLQTDDSDLAEGLYLKVEENGVVQDRFKFVRGDFVQAIAASDSHWLDRPILPNRLSEGVDIFAPQLRHSGAYDDPEAT